MRKLTRVLLALSLAGCLLSLGSTVVSVASATGHVPSWLYHRTELLSSLRRYQGVPVEFVIAALFGGGSLIIWTLSRRNDRGPFGHAFVIGVILLGLTLALAYDRGRCAPLWLMSGCAAGMVLLGAYGDPRSLRHTLYTVVTDARAGLSKGSTVGIAGVYVLLFLLIGQSISHRLTAVNPVESGSRDLARWFEAQRPIDLPALRALNGRKLVIFTDYQCPLCSIMVPQYRSVVSGLRLGGRPIELEVRDFPLEQECNSEVPVTQHPASCEAAVAMRLLASQAPNLADEFEMWLYRQRGQLSSDMLKRRLTDLGLAGTMTEQYPTLVSSVAADAKLGQSAGVYSTPTVFLDGVKLPSLTPKGLETLLTRMTPTAQ